jgi:hypothetical protein
MHQMREGIGAFIAAMGINERWGNVSLAPPELRLRAEVYYITPHSARFIPPSRRGVYFYLRAGEWGPAGKKVCILICCG